MTKRNGLAFLSVLALAAGSCGPSRAALRVSVSPNPIPVALRNCAGVFAMFPCPPTILLADLTVSVSTNDVGGQGTISVVAVDAASGNPLPDQQSTVSGAAEVVLIPHGSVTKEVRWIFPPRNVPEKLAFVVTVELSDTTGHRVTESVTVPEQLPRTWQIF